MLTFDQVIGYQLEIQQNEKRPERLEPATLGVLPDKAPGLQLSGLDQREEDIEAELPLQVQAMDDYGLVKVGLFYRAVTAGSSENTPASPAEATEAGLPWKEIVVWNAEPRQLEMAKAPKLKLSSLGVSEGDRIEIGLRTVDNDPLKEGAWQLGPVRRLAIGGEGAALQRQYEKIRRARRISRP